MELTVADRVIEYIKRRGESTPRELEDALGVKQTEFPKACEVAIRDGALVKRKDPRHGYVTYLLGPKADCWRPLRCKPRPQLPRPESAGQQIDANQNSSAHDSKLTAGDGAAATKPGVVSNPGSRPEATPATTEAAVAETPGIDSERRGMGPAPEESRAGDVQTEPAAIIAKTVAMAITDTGTMSITVNDEHVFVLDPGLSRKVGAFFGKTEGIWRG